MLKNTPIPSSHDCSALVDMINAQVEVINDHSRRIGDQASDIKALNVKYDAIMKAVSEAKDAQDKTCEAMAQIGATLTSKLETMSNTQHAMQLDFAKLSTAYSIDRESQATKKTDNRWLIGIAFSLITAANILIPLFR